MKDEDFKLDLSFLDDFARENGSEFELDNPQGTSQAD